MIKGQAGFMFKSHGYVSCRLEEERMIGGLPHTLSAK